MSDHCPGSKVVVISVVNTLVYWCPSCGSIWDNNGDHGAAAGTWRAPSSLVLPSWTCTECKAFNGSACRCCGAPRRKS